MMINTLMSLKPGARETPLSFGSRIARNHGRSLADFCSDVGLSFRGLVSGCHRAVAQLASMCHLPSGHFDRLIIGRRSATMFDVCGEELLPRNVNFNSVRVCPRCLAADLECSSPTETLRPYFRAEWAVVPIRTCAVHSCALVMLTPEMMPAGSDDFAENAESILGSLEDLIIQAVDRTPSPLEDVILKRVEGSGCIPWRVLHRGAASCGRRRL